MRLKFKNGNFAVDLQQVMNPVGEAKMLLSEAGLSSSNDLKIN